MGELISVIMGVYNEKENYLRSAVESILNQTYENIEFIIILDKPDNDVLRAVLAEYALKDQRIRLHINEKNRGLTKTLNRAISLAKGSYIARMDADDISAPSRLEKELHYLIANQLDITGCETRRIDEAGRVIVEKANRSYPPECIGKCLRYDNCVAHPTWLVRAKVYRKLHGYREIRLCEDYDFLLRANAHHYKIGICREILFCYRVNTQGISRSNGLRQMLCAEYLRRNIRRIGAVDQAELDRKVVRHISDRASKNYERALVLMDIGKEKIKHKNMPGILFMLKATFISKYICINLKNMMMLVFLKKNSKRKYQLQLDEV